MSSSVEPWSWRDVAVCGAGVAALSGVGYVAYRLLATEESKPPYQESHLVETLQMLYELGKLDFVHLHRDVWEKANKMSGTMRGGKEHLQVVTDFDMTLTRFKDEDGERYATCHGVIETSDLVPDWYRSETRQLKDHYFPLEYSASLSHAEKSVLMDEWWEKAHDSLIRSNLKQEHLATMVQESRVKFRDGATDLLNYLEMMAIPVCIVSAGIADILTEAIHQKIGKFKNMSVVSNQLKFDAAGVLNAFSEPVIHSYNKAIAVAQQCNFGSSDRYNIVLIGDSLGDPHMVPADEDLPEHFTVLRVGFLNDPSNEELRRKYEQAYDILILGDRDLAVVNQIVRTLSL
eukprot:scpid81053/ scgid14854/ Cytosolic 5&apos; Pyrimidine 5&apos